MMRTDEHYPRNGTLKSHCDQKQQENNSLKNGYYRNKKVCQTASLNSS